MNQPPSTREEDINRRPADAVSRSAGDSNRLLGWASMAVGAAVGLLMGLWSFDGPVSVPGFVGDYTDTPRRLMRLGHIAFFGLGIINVLLARELPQFTTGAKIARGAAGAMNFGNLFLPLTLFAAAVYHPLKYLLPFPAISIFIALSLTAYEMLERRRGSGT